MARSYGWISCGVSVLLVACGDNGGETMTASMSGTGTSTVGATESGTGSSSQGSMSATESGPTEGSGTVSATGTGSTGSTDSATSMPVTSGPSSSTDPMTSTSGSTDGTSVGPGGSSSSSGGVPGVCGDGKVDPGEQCDDGANNGPDQDCLPDCTPHVCGDGVQSPAEDCDLGAMNGPDNGCSTECKILPSACGSQTAEAEIVPLPVDIIFLVDNSGSMTNEILGVQSNINNNFATIIGNSGIDYRVIMVSEHGSANANQSICIEAPLSGIAPGGCNNPPAQPVNGAKFFHYSYPILSTDSWCKLHPTFKGTLKDQFNFAPMGWQQWLRPDSFKVFVEITDDRVSCSANGYSYNDLNTVAGGMTAAAKFDSDLFVTSPLHFGSAMARNYTWYSIVGLAYNNPPTDPYSAKDPIITAKCPTAVNGGIGYQTLSNTTDALRFPLCDTTKYDVVFQAIAQGVVSNTKISCEFTIPEAPMGKSLDKDSILVEFTPTGQNMPVVFMQVPDVNQCNATSFYVMGDKVILCPEACATVQADKTGKVEVNFTCEPLMPN